MVWSRVGGEGLQVIDPQFNIQYFDTGRGTGRVEFEEAFIDDGVSQHRLTGTKFTWGTYVGGIIEDARYYNDSGQVVAASIELKSDGSILSLFHRPGWIVDRSVLALVYIFEEDGVVALERAVYYEQGGLRGDRSRNDAILMGGVATWLREDLPDALAPYSEWGFWETCYTTPAQMVADAMDAGKAALENTNPTYRIVDSDSVREVFGMQTGMSMYTKGLNEFGRLRFEYSQNLGTQPNVVSQLRGLTHVHWDMENNIEDLHLLILAPFMSPTPAALYIFTTSPEFVAEIRSMEEGTWPQLYTELYHREEVLMAVLITGGSRNQTASVTGGDGSVTLGEIGGLRYDLFQEVSYHDVEMVRNYLSLLGKYGLYSLGMGYPQTSSGLYYYTAILSLTQGVEEGVESPINNVLILDRLDIVNFSQVFE